jgi:hypothetical protein
VDIEDEARRRTSRMRVLLVYTGVLVDTERDGHRVSFNEAFKRKGLDHEWGVELYGHLLEIGGGKERMTKYFKVRVMAVACMLGQHCSMHAQLPMMPCSCCTNALPLAYSVI